MPKGFGRDLPMDTRIIRDIQRSPSMSAEQGPGWLNEWGGPSGYSFWAGQPVNDRVVYFAVTEGYSTQKDIRDATGLSSGEVLTSLTKLERKGLIETGQVAV